MIESDIDYEISEDTFLQSSHGEKHNINLTIVSGKSITDKFINSTVPNMKYTSNNLDESEIMEMSGIGTSSRTFL